MSKRDTKEKELVKIVYKQYRKLNEKNKKNESSSH